MLCRVCALNSWFYFKQLLTNKVRKGRRAGTFIKEGSESNELIITNAEYVYVHTNKLLFLLN
jgi:hypothetical protein